MIPGFEIDHDHILVQALKNKTAYHIEADHKCERHATPTAATKDKKLIAYCYPGFKVTFKATRDPLGRVIKAFFPCFILALFSMMNFFINQSDLHYRLGNIGIVFLTYIQILGQMKSDLPEISDITIGDKLCMTFASTSFLSIAYLFIG